MPAMFGKVEHDDPRRWSAVAHHAEKRRKILPERIDLAIDVGSLIGTATASAKRCDNRVDVVRAREYGDERGVGEHEWRRLLENIALTSCARTAIRDPVAGG